ATTHRPRDSADEAAVVTAGLLCEQSTIDDDTLNGDGTSTITDIATGNDVTTGAIAGSGGGGGTPDAIAAWRGDVGTVGTLSSVSSTNGAGSTNWLMIGGQQSQDLWNAQLDGWLS
ncbi:MAG: hypothetical protein AAGG08_18350, partial [Actinomycetota bacterium]